MTEGAHAIDLRGALKPAVERVVGSMFTILDLMAEADARLAREYALMRPQRSLERGLAAFWRQQAAALLARWRPAREAWRVREAEPSADPDRFDDAWSATADATAAALQELVAAGILRALEAGGAAALADLGVRASFDLANPRAVAYLEAAGAALVTNVNETTRETIKRIVVDGAAAGTPYSKIAREITARFREFGAPKPQGHIQNRATLVAVTELGNAYAEGRMISAQATAEGGASVQKSWLTSNDPKVSEGCEANQKAGWIGVDEAFPSGHQRPLRFPGCRCDVLFRRAPRRKAVEA